MTTVTQNLKHGEYKININKINSDKIIIIEEAIMKPLSQEDLSEGWLRVRPKRKDVIHHFSIYLSQLPSNLWSKVKRNYSDDKTKDYYHKIKDGNYHYTIKNSVNDELIFELYNNLMTSRPKLRKIRDLYNELNNNRVKGWIMFKAGKFIELRVE
jgi:hypothetical protein